MTAKDLKNALLQEAVQGKLVPQIASEGNARYLLEKIRKEKLSHGLDFANAKSGKRNKKETALASSNPCDISENEIPFDIPESWCWCRLGEIVFNHGQKTPDKEFSYIDIGSIDNQHQKLNAKENFIMPDKAPSRARKIVKEGDVIYSTVRPYLHNICIIDKQFSREPIASTGFAVMASPSGLSNKYLFYYLLSPAFDNYANATDNAKGVAYPAINDEKLYKALFPLPPLAEQKRIVAALEKLLPLIEEYGKKETALRQLNAQIGVLTKKAILQEAVQGKLVPQIASEGNARDLLEEIRKEKLSHGLDFANAKSGKKNKKETALAGSNPCDISEDEIPFDIPESWCWCRLGEVVELKSGSQYEESDSGTLYLKVADMNLPENTYEIITSTRCTNCLDDSFIPKYSIIFPKRGGAISTNKKKLILKEKVFIDSNTMGMIPKKNELLPYLYRWFDSIDLGELSTGTSVPQINNKDLYPLYIPLPPLAEQKRIVAALEKLLPLCERLGK